MKSLIRSTCLLVVVVLMGAMAQAQDSLYSNAFPLSDVALLNGPFKDARTLNIQTLLKYDVDRLLAPYRKEAGLPPIAKSYSNWEGLDGHIGGHYLSALAMHYAATGNKECKARMDQMIETLRICQQAQGANHPEWGIGYAGGVPNSKVIWTALQKGDFAPYRSTWVPWYNLHKTYAGLRDAWLYTGNQEAKKIFLAFCDWAIDITAALSDQQMQEMLDTEHGGMNEIMADAYQMTSLPRYLEAARRFSHHMLLDAMADRRDNLDNKHANTQVPKVIGFQRIGELAFDEKYSRAGHFFWETVTSNRTVAFGGNSRREFFPSAAACTDFINDVEGPESCNSNNMLKLTEDLFRVKQEARYIDYYERVLYNHILSTQHPVHGGYVYFTPLRPRHYRVYSTPNEGMWCCVGTGMENHGQYNRMIYTHQSDSLFVNLFIASELNWKQKGVVLRQETSFPEEEQTKILVKEGAASFTLMVRYPSWVKTGTLKITVNGKAMAFKQEPSSFISLRRSWKKGDCIQVIFPMRNTIEYLPNVSSYIAILHGPILLGAKTGTEKLDGLLANEGRWAHIANGERLPVDKAPLLVEDHLQAMVDKLIPVKGRPLTFTFPAVHMINPATLQLEPFFRIHDARYMIYWMALNKAQYRSYLDSLSKEESAKLALQRRTLDYVAPGEQQPEADHALLSQQSGSGTTMNQFWREARDGGYFSYELATKGQTHCSLLVRYWGAEWGNRQFDIYIGEEKLVTEKNSGRWNQSAFFEVEYPIPSRLLEGKSTVRVKFLAKPGASAGPVYFIRLLNNQP